MMDDLVEWLRAQLDEDERVARAAFSHPSRWTGSEWERVGTDDGVWSTDDCFVEGIGLTIYDEGGHFPEQADHIARHDPARVLRDVEAKRHLLEQAELRGRAIRTATLDGGFFDHILRVLALPYSDRPGYQEEWRP